jgi:Uncharacterized conserved protein (some members contain a von Willebrand factor type A (vWA) domain)
VLGLAAVNTGNNALVLMLGLAMGSFVLSGTWSRQVLGRVSVHFVLPRRLHAETPALVEVEIENGSRLFPAYGLVLREAGGGEVLFEPFVPCRGRRRRTIRFVPPRRGRVTVGPWRLEVVLPLGFFVKSKQVGEAVEALVYPRLLDGGAAALKALGIKTEGFGMRRAARAGDVLQLRTYRDGDERRQIHWKQTARQQRLIAVEREAAGGEPLYVVVDPRSPHPEDTRVRERFETVVSVAATTVAERLRRGLPVGVVVGSAVVPPTARPGDLGRLLAPLAVVELEAAGGPPPAVPGTCRTLRLDAEGVAA